MKTEQRRHVSVVLQTSMTTVWDPLIQTSSSSSECRVPLTFNTSITGDALALAYDGVPYLHDRQKMSNGSSEWRSYISHPSSCHCGKD